MSAAAEAAHRDAGLIRGIGLTAFTASIVNGVVGAGIFTLPASVQLLAGTAAPLVYLLCAVFMGGVVLCFAEAGSRVPTSGGVYGTVEAAFGPRAGYVTGMLLLVSSWLASGGVAAAVADMLGTLIPACAAGPGRLALLAAIYLLVIAANLVGVRRTAGLITAATAIKLAPLLLFLLIGAATAFHPAPAGPPAPPVTLSGFGRGLILTLFAFAGMETGASASGEVQNPARTVPRALIVGMLFVLALYLGVQLTAQHLLGTALAHTPTPLAAAAGTVSPPARIILLAAAGFSMLVWLANDVLGSSRLLFAFGRDGGLPALLGALHPRLRVPVNAVLIYGAIAALLAMTGSFLELVTLSALTNVALYIAACTAALSLRRRQVALAGRPIVIPGLTFAALIGLAGMACILAASHWSEIGGLAIVILGSLALHAAFSRRQGNIG